MISEFEFASVDDDAAAAADTLRRNFSAVTTSLTVNSHETIVSSYDETNGNFYAFGSSPKATKLKNNCNSKKTFLFFSLRRVPCACYVGINVKKLSTLEVGLI